MKRTISVLAAAAAIALLSACGASPDSNPSGVGPLAETMASPTPSADTPSSPEKLAGLRASFEGTSWESGNGTLYTFNADGTITTAVDGNEHADLNDTWFVDAPGELTLAFSEGETSWMELEATLPNTNTVSDTSELTLTGTGSNNGLESDITLSLTSAIES